MAKNWKNKNKLHVGKWEKKLKYMGKWEKNINCGEKNGGNQKINPWGNEKKEFNYGKNGGK